jgi:Leucine-rich repeat (LRR) protein
VTSPERLTFAEADARLDGALSATFQGSYDSVLYFGGDVTVDGDLLDGVPDDAEVIVVAGDLTVSGRVACYEYTPALYVGGYTRAQTLEGGDAEVYVSDGEFTGFVYGYYNDGILHTGTVRTPWVIRSDHDMEVTAPDAYLVDNYGDDDDADFTRENIADCFVPEVVDAKYGSLDMRRFSEQLLAGLPVLRPGAMTAVQAALAEVSRAREERLTRVDMSGRKLKSFPAELLEMPWLRSLILDDNPIGAVPPEIDRLGELEHLSLADCGLTELPFVIGALVNLKTLDVSGNDGLVLPDCLGELTKLVELRISGLSSQPDGSGLREATAWPLPPSAAGLTSLRRLVADQTNVVFPQEMLGLPSLEQISMQGSSYRYLLSFPDSVTMFPGLTSLDLGSNFFSEIPAGLLRLTELEELDLGNALGLVAKPLPDLCGLPKLRVLNVSGNTDHTGVPVPAHSLLRPLFDMGMLALEDLRVDRWGESKKGNRTTMPASLLTGIGAFTTLRRLDLSFNGLDGLPDDFYELTGLEEIDLRYNRLDRATRQRIAAAFPAARIDFRDQRGPDHEAEQREAEVAALLVKDANKLRSQRDWAGALAAYDRAITQFTDGTADSPYNLLYAYYSKMWIHGKLGYDDDTDAEQAAGHRREGVAVAEVCLRQVPPVWQIFHFTDEGQFQREVVRYATNFIAWELSQAGEDLDRALTLIEQGVACADGAEHVYLHDTHARVLLAQGKEESAWRVVRQALAIDPSFEPIQDLARDPRYLAFSTPEGA